MIIRNGVHSIFRAKKLCLLFLLLTGILSAVLCLGLGVFSAADATLSHYRRTYRSVGRIEYIGGYYPDETAADPSAAKAYEQLDVNEISSPDGVLMAEKKNFTLGYTGGFKRYRSEIPYKNSAVLLVGSMHALDEELTETETVYDPVFAQTCIITDAYSGALTIHTPDGVSELRNFTYDFRDGSYTEKIYENGVFTEQKLKEMDLPEEYVLSFPASDRQEYRFSNSPLLEDRNIERWLYDPHEGSYTKQIYKVSEFTAILNDALYSRKDERKILIRVKSGSFDFEPEEKRKYMIHGSFVDAETSNLVFEIREFPDSSENPWLDITDMDRESLDDTVFGTCADRYRRGNNYLNVYSSADVSLLEPFHQGWLTISEGRFPEKYEDHACVIDHSLADQLGLSVGSVLPLSFMKSSPDSLFDTAEVFPAENYEVTGICAENNDYQGEVFISSSQPFDTPYFGCQSAYVLFDNEKALGAAEEVRSLLPEGMRLTLYDQGYETNSQPLKALRSASLAISGIGSLAAMASLILFAFLYIYRNKETIATLSSLGLSTIQIILWMLSGIVCIVAAGSLAGALTGALTQRMITSFSMNAAASLYASDVRYSAAATGFHRASEIVSGNLLLNMLICVSAIMIAAVILSLLFIRLTMRESTPSKGFQKVKIPEAGTSVRGKGVLRHARSGFERGGSRTASVILVCFALSMLLCGFAAMDLQRQDDLNRLYENTEIRGSIVSLNGRYRSDLIVSENLVRKFNRSGFISAFHLSNARQRYWLKGEMPHFANTSFGEESREAWIGRQCRLIFADSLEAVQDFFYAPAAVSWREGYDESFLTGEYPRINEYMITDPATGNRVMKEAVPALIPEGRFDEETLAQPEIEIESTGGVLRLIPAGIYHETSSSPGICLPLSLLYDRNDLYDEPEESRNYYRSEFIFTTGSFVLKSAEDLSAFKNFLAQNRYSEVNNVHYDRTTVLIDDAVFLDTLSTLTRSISFMRMIYPVLAGFTILTGFLISWLMINGRRMDFAIMKGLGASRFKVFMIFFLEQAYAAGTGILPVLILSFFISKPLIIVMFALSYLAGTALSIILASRENLMVLLAERE